MKFFTSVKLATYANEAFKAAGLDLEALAAAGDKDAIKNAIAAKSGSAEAEQALEAAVAENAELSAKLAEASGYKADAEKYAALHAAAKDAGLNPDEPEKLKEQSETAVAAKARLMIAKSGHPGVTDDIKPDAAGARKEAAKADKPQLTGRDRMARAFQEQVNRYRQNERNGSN